MDWFSITYIALVTIIVLGVLAMSMVNWYRCAMAPKDAFIEAHQKYIQILYKQAEYEKRRKEGKNE